MSNVDDVVKLCREEKYSEAENIFQRMSLNEDAPLTTMSRVWWVIKSIKALTQSQFSVLERMVTEEFIRRAKQ